MNPKHIEILEGLAANNRKCIESAENEGGWLSEIITDIHKQELEALEHAIYLMKAETSTGGDLILICLKAE